MRAGFFVRLAAVVLDMVLMVALSGGLQLIAAQLAPEASTPKSSMARPSVRSDILPNLPEMSVGVSSLMTILFLVPLAIPFFFEVLLNGTPGKYLLGLRITSAAGTWASIGQKAARCALKNVGMFVSITAALLWIWRGSPEGVLGLIIAGSFASLIMTLGTLRALGQSRQTLYDLYSDTAVCWVHEMREGSPPATSFGRDRLVSDVRRHNSSRACTGLIYR